jgi:hypothetical protein
MLKEALHIEATIRPVQISVWFDEAQRLAILTSPSAPLFHLY